MKNSLRIHKWTHNEFNIFILGVLTHPLNLYKKVRCLADSNIMEYLNMNNFFNMPDADMKLMLEAAAESPPEVTENE